MKTLAMLPPDATDKQIDAGLMALGWTPDDWQLVEMHRMRKDREYGGNVARQNGKSYNNHWRGIERGIFFGQSGCITVHNDTLRRKLMREIIADLETAQKMGLVKKILQGDDSMVEFTNGAVMAVRIRSTGFITGLTLDYLINDEAQKCSDDVISEALPVLRRSKLGAVAYVGTPQTEDDFRTYGINTFTRMLESGKMGSSNRAAYPEITDELLQMEDIPWKELRRANPSWKKMPNYTKDMREAWASWDREKFWNQLGAVPRIRDLGEQRKPPRFDIETVDGFMTGKGSVATRFVVSIGITAESDLAYAAFNDGTRTEVGHRWEIPYGELHQMAEDIRSQARNFTQIRISGTPRGKALADMLKERNLGPKVKLMGMPEISSNLNLLISQLEKGELFIRGDSKGETKSALSNFWLELNHRSGGVLPVSTLKTEEALIVALANSAMDERLATRLKSLHRNIEPADSDSEAPVKKRVRHAW